MTRTTRRMVGGVAALALAIVASGCAARPNRGGFNCDRRWGMGTLGGAVTGALIGGGVGSGIVATSGETEQQTKDYATAAAIGAVSGALLGGLFGHCAFDPPYEEAPPPPPPPPPPQPPPPAKKRIVLRGVNFAFNKWNISPEAADTLDEAAHILRENPGVDVSVDGYTDDIGSAGYNQGLSERRADAVRDYLVRLGVGSSRLRARGFGKSHPVASNETPEGRAQNRRVELVVIGR